MINLMIVDDELLEIEGIKSTLDFRALGISEIYEASNIRKAKELFSIHSVDILLCDIEMPQGNGLELLTWVKEHFPKTECIFITCHADFHYAKQAIQLGSLDYLLKPAQPDELEKVVRKALESIKKASEIIDNTRFSKLWLKHQPLIVEHFWLDVLSHKIPSTHEDMRKAALEINFPGLEEMQVFPILIRTQRWPKKLDPRDEKLMEFALKNIAQEVILKESGNGIIIDTGNGALIAMIYIESSEHIDFNGVKEDCSKYITACQRYLECELSCYMGSTALSHDLRNTVERLIMLDLNNVTHTNKVIALCDSSLASTEINLPDMSTWALMLEQGEKNKLFSEIEKYLQNLMDTMELNSNVMHQIQLDFVQMLSLFLKGKSIQAHILFKDNESIAYFSSATRSVRHMLQWMLHDVERALQCVNKVEKSQSVIGKVQSYIAQNIDKEITCEEIAAKVFLNPIYLTRIFKKETGMAVSEYLQQERLKVAQDLLSRTNMPVSNVAAHVGYSNFSHFSRMFRKYTGLSPVDFRKKLAQRT
ncbi:two-component system response regulator YesN [Anaerobacterium chartisolvens]|uniref:Stage 0 sporulation protein A homolog n=1 Tax=Anaerobacterium chartisolvens TaxID=1297424 RepID=A0A369AR33_9FIRM|nr:helix-turn-helix domain-containing protein [Anaerobacterium chartisolvens]RCX09914.1 two-component system response regulator YesN [Anaerobacterium chartisolvens]